MKKIAYRALSHVALSSLHECFLEAFSDYQVDMRVSQQQFEQRLLRDGVDLEISAGAFDDDKLIGFYLNAQGVWRGEKTAYDAGTGVISACRRHGVAKGLFAFLVPVFAEAGISKYLLEVLTSNVKAVALYRNLGFVETRRLAVFRSDTLVRSERNLEGAEIRRTEELDWELFESFWDGYPSWQNSIDAVKRVPAERVVVGAYVGGECIGYGVAFAPATSLMQLAVARKHRRRGIGTSILSALQREAPATECLKVNNVDETLEGTLAFFQANGFKMVLEQFEMIKSL